MGYSQVQETSTRHVLTSISYIWRGMMRLFPNNILTIRLDDRISLFSTLLILISARDSYSTENRRVKCGAMSIYVFMAADRRKRKMAARKIGAYARNVKLPRFDASVDSDPQLSCHSIDRSIRSIDNRQTIFDQSCSSLATRISSLLIHIPAFWINRDKYVTRYECKRLSVYSSLLSMWCIKYVGNMSNWNVRGIIRVFYDWSKDSIKILMTRCQSCGK